MDGVRTMQQKTREQRRKLMRKQKLYGLVFVLLSIFVVIMCMIRNKLINPNPWRWRMRWRWGGWIEKVESQVNFKNRTAETMMEGLFHVVFQDRL